MVSRGTVYVIKGATLSHLKVPDAYFTGELSPMSGWIATRRKDAKRYPSWERALDDIARASAVLYRARVVPLVVRRKRPARPTVAELVRVTHDSPMHFTLTVNNTPVNAWADERVAEEVAANLRTALAPFFPTAKEGT